MPESYTVQAFASKGSKPNPHGGTLYKWEVALNDEKGETHHGVYWQSKSDELHEGQEVYGEITDGEYGPRFRTAQREDGPPTGSRQGGSQALSKDDYWRRKDDRDVESQARMGRAHAQEMALRHAAAFGPGPGSPADLLTLIDWFHQDVQRFPLDADVGGGTPDSDAPGIALSASAADVSAEEASPAQKGKLTELFHKAGLNRDAMEAIVLWRCKSEKATKQGASQLITDLLDGATADVLLAEVWDGKRAGDPLGARAAALIPTEVPGDTEGLGEVQEPNGEDKVPF